MPRRIRRINRIPVTIRVQMPEFFPVSPVTVLGYKPPRLRVVIPGVHVVQPGRAIYDGAGIGEAVDKSACRRSIPVSSICIILYHNIRRIYEVRYAAMVILPEEVVAAAVSPAVDDIPARVEHVLLYYIIVTTFCIEQVYAVVVV